jgi:hypothetical protein
MLKLVVYFLDRLSDIHIPFMRVYCASEDQLKAANTVYLLLRQMYGALDQIGPYQRLAVTSERLLVGKLTSMAISEDADWPVHITDYLQRNNSSKEKLLEEQKFLLELHIADMNFLVVYVLPWDKTVLSPILRSLKGHEPSSTTSLTLTVSCMQSTLTRANATIVDQPLLLEPSCRHVPGAREGYTAEETAKLQTGNSTRPCANCSNFKLKLFPMGRSLLHFHRLAETSDFMLQFEQTFHGAVSNQC